MRIERADAGYLWDMLVYARGIATSVGGLTFEAYQADEDVRLAVERRLEIIGEAARKISRSLKAAHPEIPWRRIVAQRNVLAHEYGEVDDVLVWNVAREEIPTLVRALEPLVPSPPHEQEP